ncbi:hypothetical protein ACFSKM_07730 [Ancylobacter dichloromethanicus]
MSAILPIGPAPRIAGPYTASAGQTNFTFGFALIGAEDLAVQTAPADNPLTWTTHTWLADYTLTTAPPLVEGGTVVFNAGLAAGTRVRVLGSALIANTQDPLPAGKVDSVLLNRFFDRTTIWAQELRRDLERILPFIEYADIEAVGWTPILAVVADGERRVMRVSDWTGGFGPKPPVGVYLGETGLVANVALATDIRGPRSVGGVPPLGTAFNSLLATDIALLDIPEEVDAFETAGHTVLGFGGARYVRFHMTTPGGLQSEDGSWWKLAEDQRVNVAMFGADMTGATFSDAAWAAFWAWLIASPTSPPDFAGWGMRKGWVGKGIVKVENGLPTMDVRSLEVEGGGPFSTVIAYHSDSGVMLDFAVNLWLRLKNMTLRHVATDPDRSTWTCTAIRRSGVNGGNHFKLENIRFEGFAYGDRQTGAGNGDRNLWDTVHFVDTRTCIYGRTSQAVVNNFRNMSFYGKIERAYDIAGYGHTKIDTGSNIIDGTLLYLGNGSGLWGADVEHQGRQHEGRVSQSRRP